MFNWFSSFFAGLAFDAAIYSAGVASAGGMHQIKEPMNLREVAKEHKRAKRG